MRNQDTAYQSCITCLRPPLVHPFQDINGDLFKLQSAFISGYEAALDADDNILTRIAQRKTTRMPSPSRFLALPAELRLEIYEHTLQEPSALGIGGPHTLSPLAPKIFGGDAVKQATQPPITLVSHQLRRETLPLFYRLNTFVLAVHYRRARADVDTWIAFISSNPQISTNLRTVTIKHRFGILDFRGTIDFDFREFRILGPKLWYNAIPPMTRREVERVVDEANRAERSHEVIARTLRELVEILGIEPPMQAVARGV